MAVEGKPLLLLLRGDHQLSAAKLPGARQAEAAQIREWFGADPGSIGPVGVNEHPHHRGRSAAWAAQHDRGCE